MTEPEESDGGPAVSPAPPASPASSASQGPPPGARDDRGDRNDGDRASALRVLAVAALLLLLTAAGGLLLLPGDATVEPEDFLAEVFAGVTLPLPGGLEVDEGRRLPTGERFVRFAAATPAPSGAMELTIIEVPRARGEAVLKEQLTGLRFESSEGGSGRGQGRPGRPGAGGGWGAKEPTYKLREKGTFRWHGYDADFARLWHPLKTPEADRGADDAELGPTVEPGSTVEEGGYQTIRVNLSTGGRCLMGYLRFEEGQAAHPDDAAAILSSLRPLDD